VDWHAFARSHDDCQVDDDCVQFGDDGSCNGGDGIRAFLNRRFEKEAQPYSERYAAAQCATEWTDLGWDVSGTLAVRCIEKKCAGQFQYCNAELDGGPWLFWEHN
jgi:hypothetical protein